MELCGHHTWSDLCRNFYAFFTVGGFVRNDTGRDFLDRPYALHLYGSLTNRIAQGRHVFPSRILRDAPFE
jgi:hypothetical protein